MVIILTCGTFDLFHIGHLNMLKRCKELANGGKLIVGVSSDELSQKKKNKLPMINLKDRMEICLGCKYVDEVFIEESLDEKQKYITRYQADIFVIGDDWKNQFDFLRCQVIYLPRTENISSTELIERGCSKNKVLIHGKFDIFHSGHATLIEEARKYGAIIVALYHDDGSFVNTRGTRFFIMSNVKGVEKVMHMKLGQNIRDIISEYCITHIISGDTKIVRNGAREIVPTGLGEICTEIYIPENGMNINIIYLSLEQKYSSNAISRGYCPVLYNNCFISSHGSLMIYRTFYAITQIFEKYEAVYTVTGGSLLGAIRHKGIIPWDDDGDLGWIPFDEAKNERMKIDLFNEFGIISPHTYTGKFGFAGFGKCNKIFNVHACAVDFFEIIGTEGDWYLKDFPEQRFSSVKVSEMIEFGPIKVRCASEAKEHLIKCFEDCLDTVKDHHNHTSMAPKIIPNHRLVDELRISQFCPGNVIFPDLPESILVHKSFEGNSILTHFDKYSFFSGFPQQVSDSLILMDVSLYDLCRAQWIYFSMVEYRHEFSGSQIWIHVGDVTIQETENSDILLLQSLDQIPFYLGISPFKTFRKNFSKGYSVDNYT